MASPIDILSLPYDPTDDPELDVLGRAVGGQDPLQSLPRTQDILSLPYDPTDDPEMESIAAAVDGRSTGPVQNPMAQPYGAGPPGLQQLIELLMASEPPVTGALQTAQQPLDQWPFDTPMMPTLTNMGVGGHPADPNQPIGYGEPITFGDALRFQLPQSAAELPFELIGPAGDIARQTPDILAMVKAFHGTRRGAADAIRKTGFDPTKIGTGEGAQAFGFGHYFAENPGVAHSYKIDADRLGRDISEQITISPDEAYRANLSDGRSQDFWNEKEAREWIVENDPVHSGDLLDITIDVEPEDLLDWDKPLSEQSPKVREKLEALVEQSSEDFAPMTDLRGMVVDSNHDTRLATFGPDADGASIHALLETVYGSEGTSEALREAGIPGIRYLDQMSRDVRILPPDKSIHRKWTVGQSGGGPDQLFDSEEAARAAADKIGTRNIVIFPGEEGRIAVKGGAELTAAVRSADGRVFRGTTHGEALFAAQEAGLELDDIVDAELFETKTGELISRNEAFRRFRVRSAEDAKKKGLSK